MAGQGGNQPPLPRRIVDPDAYPVGTDIKAELIPAFHRLKRRDVEDLLRSQPVLTRDRGQIIAVAQIGMTVAKGVRHLGNHHAQALGILTKPEGHRVEHMAQQPRLCQQFDLFRAGQIVRRKNLAHPGNAASEFGRTPVIAVMQRGQVAAIARKQGRSPRRLGVQQNIVHRIAKTVLYRALAAVKGLAPDMVNPAHAACRWVTLARMASITSTALAMPSSWKPFRIHAPQNHVLRAPFIARTCP